MDSEREPVTAGGDIVEHPVELVGAPTHDMEHRAKHLLPEIAGAVELDDHRRHVGAACG